MNNSTQNAVTMNATIRYAIGAAFIALVAVAFVPIPHYIFGFSVAALYAVMSALVRSEPASWQLQTAGGAANVTTAAHRDGPRVPSTREGLTAGSR